MITHPCHPSSGQAVAVLFYRLQAEPPSILVELPDGSTQTVPAAWTDQGPRSPHKLGAAAGARLSVVALLDVLEWLGTLEDRPAEVDSASPEGS